MEIKQERYITGEPDYDVVGKFFGEVLENNNIQRKNPTTFVNIFNYKQSDDVLHIMVVGDTLKASVIERRTEFNNIEYTMCSLY